MKATLTAYSHYVKVTDFDDPVKQILYRFIDRYLAQYEINRDSYGHIAREMKYVFAARTANCKQFRFHINQLQPLIDWLRGYGLPISSEDVQQVPFKDPVPATFVVKPGWVEREGQTKALDYIFSQDPLTKMIPLQAGAGKTATTFFMMARAQMRTTLIVKASLLNQWVAAYKNQLEYKAGDIMVIQGRNDLLSLIYLAKDNELTAKFIGISNVTLQRYIADWERSSGDDPQTPVPPDELFDLIGQGILVQDEWHLAFHLNFKIDLYTNVRHVVKLSATVKPDDPFMDRMFEIAAPSETRFSGVAYNKYVHVIGYGYSINNTSKIRTTARGRTSYSHSEFEKSLMRNKKQFENYKDMVAWLINEDYIKKKAPGQKMLVYADLVDVCTEFQTYLSRRFPNLKVARKVSGDDESVLKTHEIICTTIGSMGVGTDVEDLYYVLMTPAISSRSANEQAKGRLRELKKNPDMKPVFAYLYCIDISKHVQYHRKKMEDFKGRCLTHSDLMLANHRI